MNFLLEEDYGLILSNNERIKADQIFRLEDNFYLLVKITNLSNDMIEESSLLKEFLEKTGAGIMPTLIVSRSGNNFVSREKEAYCLFKAEAYKIVEETSLAQSLATTHYIGQYFNNKITEKNYYGKWATFWGNRLDYIERLWRELLLSEAKNDFEKLFVQSFPYFLGLTENAIKYLVDTELDLEKLPADYPTICSERYSDNFIHNNYYFSNPFKLIIDHRSRDLAEIIRMKLDDKVNVVEKVGLFLNHYETINPLSSYAVRKIYARLLFPISYFECVEGYYFNKKAPVQQFKDLSKIVNEISETEEFLKEFNLIVASYDLPKLAWL